MTPKKAPPPIEVVLDAEKLQATVKVAPRAAVSADDVLGALRQAGVVHGIREDNVRLALARRGQAVVLARGVLAITGAPGRIEYECLDTTESATFTPLEDARGKVDSHGGHLMQTVEPGQILARVVAPQPGTDGRRVTGEVIPADRGKEAVPVLGPGTRLSDDRTQVVATRCGLSSMQGNRIAVLPRCEVKNVDFATGDVYFAGSVTVSGDVLPGFSVVATEDIEVRGGVDGGTLRAGGKIVVRGGITHSAALEAIGDVAVRFIDSECTVTSGATIEVRENVLRSRLVARRILVGHQLVAGHSTATELISAGLLGNESEAHTHLRIVRPQPVSAKRAVVLAKEKQKEQAQIQGLRKAINDAAHNAALLKRLFPQEVAHELTLRKLEHESALASIEVAPESGSIVAQSKLYRGVTGVLYDHVYAVAETAGKRTLRLVDGDVVDTELGARVTPVTAMAPAR